MAMQALDCTPPPALPASSPPTTVEPSSQGEELTEQVKDDSQAMDCTYDTVQTVAECDVEVAEPEKIGKSSVLGGQDATNCNTDDNLADAEDEGE